MLAAVRVDLVRVQCRPSAGQGRLGYLHAFFVRFRFLIFEFLEALLTFQAVSLACLPLLLLSSYQELNQRYRSRHGCNKMMQQNDCKKLMRTHDNQHAHRVASIGGA